MRSPGRRAAPRHRVPSVTRPCAGRGGPPAAGRGRCRAGRRRGAGRGRRPAGRGRRAGAARAGAARAGPAEGQAGQPGVAQARDDPYLRRWPGRGRGRVPGRQHVPDRAALQRPHPGKSVRVRGLPRPETSRRHAGLGSSRRPHHAQRPPRVQPRHRAPARRPPHPRPGVVARRSPAWAASRSASRTSRSSSGRAASPTRSRSAGSAGREPAAGAWPSATRGPGSPASRARAGSGAAPGREWPGGPPGPAGDRHRTLRTRWRLLVVVNGRPGAPSGCTLDGAPCTFAQPSTP